MHRIFAIAAALALAASFTGISSAQNQNRSSSAPQGQQGSKPAPGALVDPKFVTPDEKVSYGIGLEIGGNIKVSLMNMAGPMFKNLKLEAVLWGIRDGLMEDKSRVGEQELLAAQDDFQKRLEKMVAELASKNLKAAQAFLASNKSKPGVQTTKSGLQYKVNKKGNGPKPKKTDIVRVHYHGTRTDGSVFDSSIDRKEPADLEVGYLIPGWQEALELMRVGDEWTLYIPPDLAYGEAGRDGIEPNSLLIFELKLLDIVKPDELAPPAEAAGSGAARRSTTPR